MEKDSACEIFLSSIKKRGLVYEIFVGDGDTGSFGAGKQACHEKFGDVYSIVKEECVGHIQKRMGNGLREFKRKMRGIKLKDGGNVGGHGRLTDNIFDKMQNNFGEARSNAGNRDGMYHAIWTTNKHMIRNDDETLEQQHDFCPRNGWCKFWACRSEYVDKNRLPHVFVELLKPLFTRLTEDSLLESCLLGLTQNQNEAVNQVLWTKCPKTKFCGRDKVLLAVTETVAYFNTGAASKATLLKSLGVTPSENMLMALRKADSERVRKAAVKISVKARLCRRKLRAEKKCKPKSKVTYLAGGFGLSQEPEELLTTHNIKRKSVTQEEFNVDFTVETSITFVDDNDKSIEWIK